MCIFRIPSVHAQNISYYQDSAENEGENEGNDEEQNADEDENEFSCALDTSDEEE